MITVRAKRRVLGEFKKAAKAFAPREKYAVLIGHKEADLVTITELYYPPNADEHCTTWDIAVKDAWIADAQDVAEESGASVVGWIHSHVYNHSEGVDHAPSESDWDYSPSGLFGVCLVKKSNKKYRASIRFWGPTIPVRMEIK